MLSVQSKESRDKDLRTQVNGRRMDLTASFPHPSSSMSSANGHAWADEFHELAERTRCKMIVGPCEENRCETLFTRQSMRMAGPPTSYFIVILNWLLCRIFITSLAYELATFDCHSLEMICPTTIPIEFRSYLPTKPVPDVDSFSDFEMTS